MANKSGHVPPIPTYAAKPHVHAYAEGAAGRLGFGPRDPIEPFVARIGGKIRYETATSAGLPESIVVTSSSDFIIILPTMTSPQRDRFTVAHELGHLFLHFPLVEKAHPGAVMGATRRVDESDPVQQRAEWEANWFAAAFLMPSAAFRLAVEQFDSDIAAVAAYFGVSTKAAEVRARTIPRSA